MPKPDVRIFWDTSVSAYRVTSPYNMDIIAFLGKQIPVSDRSFDKSTKIWTIVERQLAPFQAFLKLLGIQPTVISRQQAEAAHSSGSSMSKPRTAPLADIALEFAKLAGQDAMNRAYRAACMTLHPDRGGSMDKMAALNVAWERLQKEVYGAQS